MPNNHPRNRTDCGEQKEKEEEKEDAQRENRSPKWRRLIMLLAWLSLIFGTSCTVIRPAEFFSMIARYTGAQPEAMRKFEIFWGVSWFAVVKGWHFTEFAILTFLTAYAVKWIRGRLSDWSILVSMVFCMLFAASDEWHQTFVPDRMGTFQDVLIDSMGICAAGTWMLWRKRRLRAPASNVAE